MNAFDGSWKDEYGATIEVKESHEFATLNYDNGRGPFTGMELSLGSPVVNVNFDDLIQPEGGLQAGVMNFDKDKITWSNGTIWKKLK